MTINNSTFKAENSAVVADILNTVSGAYCSEFWDGVYEVSGSLDTLRELSWSLEALYEAQKNKEAFMLLLALHDLIALEIPVSILDIKDYDEGIRIFLAEFLEDTADLMLDYESESAEPLEWD